MTILKKGIFTLLTYNLISCGGSGDSNANPTPEDEPSQFSIDTNSDDNPFTVDASGFIDDPERKNTEGLEFLRQCASTLPSSPQCNFSHAQLIRHTAEEAGRTVPSIEDVMLHTLASHQWMRDRFEFALREMPEDVRRLLGGVTSVVLGSHIRPSFYTGASGAIYIDAAYLWTTLEEKNSIHKNPDFRSDFGRELQFIAFSNYHFPNNGISARSPGSINDDSTRSPSSIVLSLAGLLFHELAHSNDFFPPSLQSEFDRSTNINELSDSIETEWASFKLNNLYPLQSEIWRALGQVMFAGEDATEQHKSLTASEVGAEFEMDISNDDYSYSTPFEDSAMLFEEVMMRHHFGLDRLITMLEPIENDNGEEEYFVRWGQRNRAGDERLQDRVRLLLHHYLPNQNPEVYIQSLATPEFIPTDVTYGESIEEMYPITAQETIHTEKSQVRSPRFKLKPEDFESRHFGWSH